MDLNKWYIDSVTIGYVYPEHNNQTHPAWYEGDHIPPNGYSTHTFGRCTSCTDGARYFYSYNVHNNTGDEADSVVFQTSGEGAGSASWVETHHGRDVVAEVNQAHGV